MEILVAQDSYLVTVNYDMTLEEMIRAGNYNFVDDGIDLKRFRIKGKGLKDVRIKLRGFKTIVTSDEALWSLRENKLRRWPTKLEEMLALVAKHPDILEKDSIAAFGSIGSFRGLKRVPSAGFHTITKRILSTRSLNEKWDTVWRFGISQAA